MKQQYMMLWTLGLCMAMSFAPSPSSKVADRVAGVYSGSCGDSDEKSSSRLELALNTDFTFHYFDHSNPSKIADVSGHWKLVGQTIVLTDYDAAQTIPRKWKMTGDEQCIKSRKGLAFLRLCYSRATE